MLLQTLSLRFFARHRENPLPATPAASHPQQVYEQHGSKPRTLPKRSAAIESLKIELSSNEGALLFEPNGTTFSASAFAAPAAEIQRLTARPPYEKLASPKHASTCEFFALCPLTLLESHTNDAGERQLLL
jgi:hypothetical protein